MTRTGHRSIDGVRTYKRVSDEQTRGLSCILNDATNGTVPAVKKCKHAGDQTCTDQYSPESDISQAPSSVANPSTFHFSGCIFNITSSS